MRVTATSPNHFALLLWEEALKSGGGRKKRCISCLPCLRFLNGRRVQATLLQTYVTLVVWPTFLCSLVTHDRGFFALRGVLLPLQKYPENSLSKHTFFLRINALQHENFSLSLFNTSSLPSQSPRWSLYPLPTFLLPSLHYLPEETRVPFSSFIAWLPAFHLNQ